MRFRCNCGGALPVTETRATHDVIWRTRKCKDCGTAYTTKEEAVEGNIPKEAHAPCNRAARARRKQPASTPPSPVSENSSTTEREKQHEQLQ
jgi:transcriptional regulator NrdR family protein